MRVRDATPADAEAIARVHVDTWRSTYRGLVSDDVLDNLSYRRRQKMWHRALTDERENNLIVVVEDDDGAVVGFAACGRQREGNTTYAGEIYAIYLLARRQGKGWGKALFLEAVERLKDAGMNAMMLWVLAENPTRGFYQALGGVAFDEKDIEMGGVRLTEIAYGWHWPAQNQ